MGHCDFAVGALRLRGWGIATSRLGHCDFAVGALRVGLRHSGRGAFRQWGIATIILCYTNFQGMIFEDRFSSLFFFGMAIYLDTVE